VGAVENLPEVSFGPPDRAGRRDARGVAGAPFSLV